MNGETRYKTLLVLLVMSWAISWPVIKIGVTTVPPIWFGCFRYAIASLCLFALLAARGELVVPARGDWSLIAISGAFQMAGYSALTAFALTILPPGRASVLAFSTPIWVVPLAAWWLKERVSKGAVLGVVLGLLGVVTIAAPSLRASKSDQVLAYVMLMLAALSWAISIVVVRSHRFRTTALALAPWQTLFATSLLLPLAFATEAMPHSLTGSGVASLLFVGPIATAFAYWAVIETGRHFTASTLSIALLATPPIGITLSAIILGESIGPSLVFGAALIGGAIWLATRKRYA